jgi:hypothetical protein
MLPFRNQSAPESILDGLWAFWVAPSYHNFCFFSVASEYSSLYPFFYAAIVRPEAAMGDFSPEGSGGRNQNSEK